MNQNARNQCFLDFRREVTYRSATTSRTDIVDRKTYVATEFPVPDRADSRYSGMLLGWLAGADVDVGDGDGF